jgi:hypothetical protein
MTIQKDVQDQVLIDIRIIDDTAAKAIAEITADPTLRVCRSLDDLDDVCDTNCLGGLCEDDHPIWGPDYYDSESGMNDRFVRIRDGVSEAIISHLSVQSFKDKSD